MACPVSSGQEKRDQQIEEPQHEPDRDQAQSDFVTVFRLARTYLFATACCVAFVSFLPSGGAPMFRFVRDRRLRNFVADNLNRLTMFDLGRTETNQSQYT